MVLCVVSMPEASSFPLNYHHLGIPLGIPCDPYCCWLFVVTIHLYIIALYTTQPPCQAMANPTMSDDATLHFDTAVFNPELNEMHVGRNPVFHTSCTLVPVDFANSKFADDYIKSLDEVAEVLKHGFETNETSTQINKTQWLASVAQVLAAIHEGVYCTFPLLSTEEYKAAFGPDDSNATHDFSFAVGSLHYFLTNTAVDHPNNYKQCARCLKVSSTTTTAEHFEAHLMACNRDADAVRLMVINTMIKEACNEAL